MPKNQSKSLCCLPHVSSGSAQFLTPPMSPLGNHPVLRSTKSTGDLETFQQASSRCPAGYTKVPTPVEPGTRQTMRKKGWCTLTHQRSQSSEIHTVISSGANLIKKGYLYKWACLAQVWFRAWAVLHQGQLLFYNMEDDAVPEEILDLANYCLVPQCRRMQGSTRNRLSLDLGTREPCSAPGGISSLNVLILKDQMGKKAIHLSAESKEAREEWVAAIIKSSAIDASLQSLTLNGLDLDSSGRNTFSGVCLGDPRPRKPSMNPDVRQKLIWDLIASKHVPKYHRDRRSGQDQKRFADISNRYERAEHAAQRDGLRQMVQLQQRKISAALKLDGMFRSRRLVRRATSAAAEPAAGFESQLKELKDKLMALDRNLRRTHRETRNKLVKLSTQKALEMHALTTLGVMGGSGFNTKLVKCSRRYSEQPGHRFWAPITRPKAVSTAGLYKYNPRTPETSSDAWKEIAAFERFAKNFFAKRGQLEMYLSMFQE